MYSNKLIATIQCNDNILRERGNEVVIPFGNEYSIILKNLESRKALVDITIDGKSIGDSLIVDANTSVCIERFIHNRHQGNRFKFIEKTEDISNHRGDRIDDGIVRVEFSFEKEKQEEKPQYHYHYYPFSYEGDSRIYYYSNNDVTPDYSVRTTSFSSSESYEKGGICTPRSYESPKFSSKMVDGSDGITVKGSVSDQKIIFASIGELEENKHTIVLKLKGYNSKQQQVKKPVFVKDKLQCETCGKTSKSDSQYCRFCGTFLA